MAHQVSEPTSFSDYENSRRPRHTFWWYVKWFFITMQVVLFCVIVATVAILYGVYNRLNEIVPDVRSITVRTKAEPTTVWAADGTLLAKFQGEYRDWVDFADLQRKVQRNGQTFYEPGYLAAATVAVEDWRFYSHMGMDPIRIAKAALVNLTHGHVSQGGSTITEQLATNLYLTRTRTVARRLQEALLALKLERTFSKDEILTLYLNEIYYGNNAYGCEAASERYFDKPAGKLSIAQAAFLAGLPNSPTNFDPFDHFDRAKKRQRVVLNAMFTRHKINYQQYQDALNDDSLQKEIEKSKIRYKSQRTETSHWRAPYFVAYVKKYLQQNYNWSDEFLTKGGLKIYTTLDPTIQKAAKRIMDRRLSQLSSRKKVLQGALVCIDPWTGHIVAMYGGRDFYDAKMGGQFNRATMAKRQPGSTFKPYIYATAMEAGYTPDSKVMDKPLTVNGHDVHNDDHRYRGLITFQKALGISDNVAATRILLRLGIGNVIDKAHQFGITSVLRPVPSLALGTSEITLLENTSAFGVFATGGLRAEPTPVERVDNSAGETLVQHAHPVQAARVISEPSAKEMQQMLRYVVTSGTGQNADISGLEVIGKTGTTSDNKDVWFMGATKQLVCGIWMGYDLPSELHGSSGGGWCAPAWRSFMEKASDVWSKRDPVQKLVESARATQLRRIQADQDRHSSSDTRERPRSIDDNSRSNDSTPSANQSPPSRSDQPQEQPAQPPSPSDNPPAPPAPNSNPNSSAPVRRYYNDGDSGNISGADNSPIPNQQ
jgi:penicillin-binding protein 1A